MVKRILIIPPTTEFSVRKRLREIGFALSKYHRVYFLNWSEPRGRGFIERMKAALKDIFKKTKVYEKEGVLLAEYPLIHRPLFMVKPYNAKSLERFLIRQNIDVLINGMHYFFFTPSAKKYNYKHIFDVNDLPAENINSALGRFAYEFAKQEAKKADVITAASQGLVAYIQDHFQRKACFIPNGAYLEEFKTINEDTIEGIRKKHNLLGKFVIGYIGYVGEWIDIDFLINVFMALKSKNNGVALMIIGEGPKIDYYKSRLKDKDIIFTGGIHPSRISDYFLLIDIGVLPSKINIFQNVAFHIKLIEYTAARKMVVSTPLEEVKRLGFPNIFMADTKIEEWVKAIEGMLQKRWNPAWDNLANGYDWNNIGRDFLRLIDSA